MLLSLLLFKLSSGSLDHFFLRQLMSCCGLMASGGYSSRGGRGIALYGLCNNGINDTLCSEHFHRHLLPVAFIDYDSRSICS